MTPSLKKRFWKEAKVIHLKDGFVIELDGRTIQTPSKALLKVDFRTIAEEIAKEWMAQDEIVDHNSMPTTRMKNSVMDKITVNKNDMIDMISE